MDVLMPQLGETVAEGKITKWFKSTGDAVQPGETLFEIETDKTAMDVPATSAGTLAEILFGVGEVAKVGAVVAVIAGAAPLARSGPAEAPGIGKTSATPTPYSARLDPWREVRTPQRNFGPAKLPGGAVVTPLARRLASERGVDLSHISGSGPYGRVFARDVERAISTGAPSVSGSGATAAQIKALYDGVRYEEVPLDAMRCAIARRLVEAKQTIPHFYLTADIQIGRLATLREEANAAASQYNDSRPAFKLSLNDFMIKAWAMALQRSAAANAVWAEDRILRFEHSDIGVAVAIDGGLIAPVIRNVESKSLTEISAEMHDLIERAREKKLKPNEYQGGASAISNLGMYGVREFAAIINPPHSTILAVGANRRTPIETAEGGVEFINQMTVTLSCDHRVVDGALGSKLLAAFRRIIENPVVMMI